MKPRPNAREEFQKMIDHRGAALRKLSLQELMSAGDEPGEEIEMQRRRGRICNIVEKQDDGSLRVVVQGFLYSRYIPWLSNVALDGFYKRPSGNVEPMPDEEFYEFD